MKSVATVVAIVISANLAAPACAAESWIQCDGNVVTTGGAAGNQDSKPAHDVYAYSDDTQHLFKYSDTRKSLDQIFVTAYSPKEIKWSSPSGASYGDARWEGSLDRSKLALSIVRHERGETMTWTETCKPTQPLIK